MKRNASAALSRNDDRPEVVNSRPAEVHAAGNGRVTFRLEDGQRLELAVAARVRR